jgi:hypothetical protein
MTCSALYYPKKCCVPALGKCTADTDCCAGGYGTINNQCLGGVCRVAYKNYCYHTEECVPGDVCDIITSPDTGGTCYTSPGGACPTGTCSLYGYTCLSGTCCLPSGQSCSYAGHGDDSCCSGWCGSYSYCD